MVILGMALKERNPKFDQFKFYKACRNKNPESWERKYDQIYY